LMSSEWDDESDTYTDIDCVRRIDKELGLWQNKNTQKCLKN
jgi:hypothetical protein